MYFDGVIIAFVFVAFLFLFFLLSKQCTRKRIHTPSLLPEVHLIV